MNYLTLGVAGLSSILSIFNFSPQQTKEAKPKTEGIFIQQFNPNKKIDVRRLEEHLKNHQIDQRVAIKLICQNLLRQSTIWSIGNNSPLCFLFLGPERVGQTHLARHIAQSQGRTFVYFDMRFFQKNLENFASLKNPDAKLNKILKDYPNATIVLDHMEKMTPEIFNFLTRLYHNGQIWKVEKGEEKNPKKEKKEVKHLVMDARKAIFILCANIGDEIITKLLHTSIKSTVPPSQVDQNIFDSLDRVIEFRQSIEPELLELFKCHRLFIRRMNAIIPFFPFSNIDLANEIIKILNTFVHKAKEKKRLHLSWNEGVVIWLMMRWKPSIPIEFLIETHVLSVLADRDAMMREGDHVHLYVGEDDQIQVTFLNRNYKILSKL